MSVYTFDPPASSVLISNLAYFLSTDIYSYRVLMVTEKAEQQSPLGLGISEEAQEQARQAVESAFRGLTEHVRQITEDVAEFNRRRIEMRRGMRNGARRTSGRIV